MEWVKTTTTEGKKVLLNVNEILSVSYCEDTDLTEFAFTRSNYPSLFVSGNVVEQLRKALSANGRCIYTLG